MSPHFSLNELIASSTAVRLGLDNTPTPEALERLKATAAMLERIREHLGRMPITITSGYRSRAVNQAVGGVTSSDHAMGQAADIVAPRAGTPYDIAKNLSLYVNELGIGQLIYESIGGKQWVHLSTRRPEKPINRVITVTSKGAQPGIQRV